MYELLSGEEGVVSDLKMMIEVGISKHNYFIFTLHLTKLLMVFSLVF